MVVFSPSTNPASFPVQKKPRLTVEAIHSRVCSLLINRLPR
ncbi:hypothetical protein [Escherichia coli]|nr:hypothetical protein [Escherichia coli]